MPSYGFSGEMESDAALDAAEDRMAASETYTIRRVRRQRPFWASGDLEEMYEPYWAAVGDETGTEYHQADTFEEVLEWGECMADDNNGTYHVNGYYGLSYEQWQAAP
jgi:hypothetical protein